MLKSTHKFLCAVMLFTCALVNAQAPTYDEMTIESDSAGSAYRASGKNFVLIKSKRGTSGLNKTPAGDAIMSAEVTEIVLVFTETDASAISEREEANRERWENLLMTYPEYFQYSTTYKNVCQCNMGGDAEALKKTQGFYVYINGEVPKTEEPASEPPAPVKKEEPAAPKTAKTEEKKPAEKEPPAPAKTEPVVETPKTKEPPAQQITSTSQEESSSTTSEAEPVKAAPKKKPAPAGPKARKAKNPKACRPACYEGGDEDLYAYFRNSIKLNKKQKRKAKSVVLTVKIQLDNEGNVKKATVTGENDAFVKMADDAIKSMNKWNAAVKGGVAVKSEVKFLLKFDKENKCLKPFDIMANPKAGPKCKCASDSEIFGD